MLSQAQSLKVFSGEIGRLSRKFSQEMNSTNEQFGVQKKKRNVAIEGRDRGSSLSKFSNILYVLECEP